jgi:dihydropteroate synthase
VPSNWTARGVAILPDPRPRVMGILNVTPDSFSDGGRSFRHEAAIARAGELVAEGADILDIGGESSRPGADPVSVDEELRRVLPVIEAIAAGMPRLPISIDTAKPEVARRALEAGAWIVNDIGGLRDPAMIRVVASSDAGVVLMHMAGTPQTMQDDPRYGDVVDEVYAYLRRQVETAQLGGIPRDRIALDPGIGFGKTHAHNLELLRNTARFATLDHALLIGTSRKGFLGKITGRPVDQRSAASVVSSLWAAIQGARVVRVHDVAPMSDAIKIWGAVHGWESQT